MEKLFEITVELCCLFPSMFTAWGKACTGKLQLCLEKPYTTKTGLKVHPDKVIARTTSAKIFNDTVQYLAKFRPRLSEISRLLSQLTVKNAEWIWKDSEERTRNGVKMTITQAPSYVTTT